MTVPACSQAAIKELQRHRCSLLNQGGFRVDLLEAIDWLAKDCDNVRGVVSKRLSAIENREPSERAIFIW